MTEIHHTIIEMNNIIVGHINKLNRAKEKWLSLKKHQYKNLSKLKCKEKRRRNET